MSDPALVSVSADILSAATGAPVHSVSRLGGGHANATFLVRRPAGLAVLRVFVRDPAARETEMAVLDRVRPVVPVPEVLWSGEVAGSAALLMSYVDGELLDQVLANGSAADVRSAATAVGRALAPVHEIALGRPGFFDSALRPAGDAGTAPDDLRRYADPLLHDGPAGQVLGAELSRAWWALIDRDADVLAAVAGQAQLVHSDYNGKNILMHRAARGWSVAAVLDWEFAFAGPPLVDVGNMLRLPAPQGFAESFARGYTDGGGRLPDRWRAVAAVLDVFALLGLLRPASALRDQVASLVRAQVQRDSLWP